VQSPAVTASWCDFTGKLVSLSYVDNAVDTPFVSFRGKFAYNVTVGSMQREVSAKLMVYLGV
jgi:hypothetical protein